MTIFETTQGIGKATLRVLRARPRLVLFPLLAIAVNLTLLLLFWPDLNDPADGVTLALIYLLGHGVSVFFTAALTCEALRALRGQPTSLAGGLGCAAARIDALAEYAAIESTAGRVLEAVARIGPWYLRIWLRMRLGDAWAMLSYLGLPVLVAERRGSWASLLRSGELMRQTWGERAMSEFAFRLLSMHLVTFLIVICLSLVYIIKDPFLLTIVIALSLASATVVATLQVIYRAALYLFAAEGIVPDEFNTPEMRALWRVQ